MARGGSYIVDPETGETTLVAETKEAPLPDPPPEADTALPVEPPPDPSPLPPAAAAVAVEPPPEPADAVGQAEGSVRPRRRAEAA